MFLALSATSPSAPIPTTTSTAVVLVMYSCGPRKGSMPIPSRASAFDFFYHYFGHALLGLKHKATPSGAGRRFSPIISSLTALGGVTTPETRRERKINVLTTSGIQQPETLALSKHWSYNNSKVVCMNVRCTPIEPTCLCIR